MSRSQLLHRSERLSLAHWWGIGTLLMLAFFAGDFLQSSGGLIESSFVWGRDFANVWTGGHLVRDGQNATIYDLEAYSAYQRTLFPGIGPHNYSYPPVTFLIAAPLSMLPYWLALALWLGATGALFVWAARPWWPAGAGPAWLAVLTPAAAVNIWAGHYGFLVGALFLLGWQRLDTRPVQAGIFFGLLLVKPHLAALVPLALLIRRDWIAIGSAAATVAALVTITTLLFGWGAWSDFLLRTSGVQAAMIYSGEAFFGLMSCSAATAALRVGASPAVAATLQAVLSIAAVAMVAIAAARRAPTRDLAFLAATATFLFLPYSFNYDLTAVAIGALWVMKVSTDATMQFRLGLYGFLAPQLGLVLAAAQLPLMPLMLAGLAVAQFRIAVGAAPSRRELEPRPLPA